MLYLSFLWLSETEMPMLINIGILLDIFVGVLILGFFGLRLKPHTNELTTLKD